MNHSITSAAPVPCSKRHASSSDREQLLAWRAGDRRAGQALIARYYRYVEQFFVNRIGQGCDAEDLTQQTFVACVEGLQRFRLESSFRTYLLGIARNKLLKLLRTRRRSREVSNPNWRTIEADQPSSVEVLMARAEYLRLRDVMHTLPQQTRTLFELHYWKGMKINEVAKVVRCCPNTVKTRLFRGRQRLARALDHQTDNRSLAA